jgi:hypothetical protein
MADEFVRANAGVPINAPHRPIFRTDAVRRYMQNQQKPVLPRFVYPRALLYLWILLGLLFLAGGFVSRLIDANTVPR